MDRIPIAALDGTTAPELRARWIALTGGPVPRISPGLLRLALAWELQARAHGGLTRNTVRALDQQARGRSQTSATRPGMRLVREWQGRAHVVTVDDAGVVHWDGRRWRSLSEVARAITGTRWSGPAFFGLTRKVAA